MYYIKDFRLRKQKYIKPLFIIILDYCGGRKGEDCNKKSVAVYHDSYYTKGSRCVNDIVWNNH